MASKVQKYWFLLFAVFSGMISPSDAGTNFRVLNGIDVLLEQNFKPLAGKRIGLVTNHTGRSVDGRRTVDLFHESAECRLVAVFSPEHGIRGAQDSDVPSSVDESTGIPIYSLYGRTERPEAEVLKRLDALVFDVQDIGARFYTYITTMAYCMEEAARADIPFYVLDRPNPLGGVHVEGPMLDADKTSFTGYMPLPVRHGMTVGELARFFNTGKSIGAELHVIKMKGWQRDYYYWDTGQVWINPSPNIRSMTEALLYPGICLLEATNVSVGRGTDSPFEIVGAPWIDPDLFYDSLRDAGLPGVQFVPVFFTPQSGPNKQSLCGGLRFLISDIERFQPVLLGLTLISVLHEMYPREFDIDGVNKLLGNEAALRMLKQRRPPAEAMMGNSADFQIFLSQRRNALIYDRAPNVKEGRQ